MSFSADANDSLSAAIYAPDPAARIIHERVHGMQRGAAEYQPLRALMFAVLEDAIACDQSAHAKLVQEAEEWINSDNDGLFSCTNICEILDINPGCVRKGLEQWKARQIGAPPEERKRLILNKGKCAGKRRKAA